MGIEEGAPPKTPSSGGAAGAHSRLVVGLCVADARLRVAPVGHGVGDVAHVPVVVGRALEDLQGLVWFWFGSVWFGLGVRWVSIVLVWCRRKLAGQPCAEKQQTESSSSHLPQLRRGDTHNDTTMQPYAESSGTPHPPTPPTSIHLSAIAICRR